MKRILSLTVLLSACLITTAHAHDSADRGWQKIVPPTSSVIIDGNGERREITPSCSGAPEVVGVNEYGLPIIAPSDTEYSFFYHKGDSEKLLIFFDGGGACWDGETCSSSILPALQPGAESTYIGKITEKSNPENLGGIFDLKNDKNPFKEYSMVVVPYCTADVHWGSNTAVYENASIAGLPLGDLVIQHRGFDNFLAVREWMKNKYKGHSRYDDDEEVRHLAVTGLSAGAYGATLAFPYMKQLFPESHAQLISDGGNGIIVNDFLEEAVRVENSSWQARGNFPNWFSAFEQAAFGNVDLFAATIYSGVAFEYPDDRVAQYTTTWDTVQMLFYNIMQSQASGAGVFNWTNLTPHLMGDWHFRMLANVELTAMAPNYRSYVAPGCIHTTLSFSDQFYAESETHIPVYKWMKKMISKRAYGWESQSCDFATCPPPTEVEVGQCLARTFQLSK